jgi:hypothetical protein
MARQVSAKRSRNRTDRVASVRARQTRRACRWSSDRRPETNGSTEFWCHEEPSRQLARRDDGSRYTAAVVDSIIRTLADVHIGHKRSRRASDRPPGTLGRLLRWRSRFETAVVSSEMPVLTPLHAIHWGMLSQPDKQKSTSRPCANFLFADDPPVPQKGS